VGADNLVDFIKDFNFEYLARVQAQDNDRQAWRSDMLAFDRAREARIAQKEMDVINMDKKLYELEVERTRNLGNMTTTLLMLASSMDALSRFVSILSLFAFYIAFTDLFLPDVYLHSWHFEPELDSLRGPP
jgi:hypothetical protein